MTPTLPPLPANFISKHTDIWERIQAIDSDDFATSLAVEEAIIKAVRDYGEQCARAAVEAERADHARRTAMLYGGLVRAAIDLLAACSENLETKPFPQKYGVPYKEVNALRAALEGHTQPAVEAPQNEWKEAVLNCLAVTCMDAPIDEPPASILKRVIDWHIQVATDPAVAPAVEARDERAAFEAWMSAVNPGVNLQHRVDGSYWSDVPDNFWEAWQARAALSAAPAAPQAEKAVCDAMFNPAAMEMSVSMALEWVRGLAVRPWSRHEKDCAVNTLHDVAETLRTLARRGEHGKENICATQPPTQQASPAPDGYLGASVMTGPHGNHVSIQFATPESAQQFFDAIEAPQQASAQGEQAQQANAQPTQEEA